MPLQVALLLFLWLFSPGLPADTLQSSEVEPQHRIALQANGETIALLTEERLAIAAAAGVDLLAIPHSTIPGAGSASDGFYILLTSDDPYRTPISLLEDREKIINGISERYREADRAFSGRVAAVELIRYSNDRDTGFIPAAAAIADTASRLIEKPFFYSSPFPDATGSLPGGLDFYAVKVTPNNLESYAGSAYTRFQPSGNERASLQVLQHIMEIKTVSGNTIVEIPADWFFERLEQQPELSRIFLSHTEGRHILFPLPAEMTDGPGINWSVLFLFLIWISLLIHLKFLPLYAQSLPRYFLNHTFLVADVMEHRIRSSMSGFIVLIQHAFITGLFFYVSAEILISPTGLEVLEHHFPYLFFLGNPLLSLFITGVVTALLLQLISVVWIYFLNRNMNYMSQALNLYSWPLHVNFLTVTLLVVLNQTGSAELWMASLSILFAVVWFFSFNIAAIDAARFLKSNQVTYIILTVGLHIAVVAFAVWLVFYTPSIYEPLRMALTFP